MPWMIARHHGSEYWLLLERAPSALFPPDLCQWTNIRACRNCTPSSSCHGCLQPHLPLNVLLSAVIAPWLLRLVCGGGALSSPSGDTPASSPAPPGTASF
ncbi:hypothetical protein PO909_003612 [Leuciscus waleckii]